MKRPDRKSKKSTKGSEIYSSVEMKRYLGALTETHNEHLKGIKEGFVLVHKKIDDLARVQNQHTEMIGIIMEDISVIKSDLKKKVDYDEFISLVRRVQKIESKI